jgi:hypothetical protein
VGEVLAALGTHAAEDHFATDRAAKFDVFSESRAAFILSACWPILLVLDSLNSVETRQFGYCACVRLVCRHLALATVEAVSKSWKSVLEPPVYSQSVLDVNEFFVTMLNDDEVRCQDKGLAYLRLRAPTEEIGVQFSESLFRWLRCFRAFAATADAADDD